MSNQISSDTARVLLAAAVKQAELTLLKFIGAGQLRHSVEAGPYTALVALATAGAAIIEGGAVEVALDELLQVMEFMATDPAYIPDPRFPFTKTQLAAALHKE